VRGRNGAVGESALLKPEQMLRDYDRIKECVSKGLERTFGEDVK